jgi:octaprenyl-diphosphate synthase
MSAIDDKPAAAYGNKAQRHGPSAPQAHASRPAATGDLVLPPLEAVTAHQELHALTARLAQLRTLLGDDLAELEAALGHVAAQLPDPATATAAHVLPGTRVPGAAAHLLSLSGKRLRPICVLLSARMGGLSLSPVLRDLAVSCELVHAATLLHDDVIDDSAERRGSAAARVLFGNSASILAGDHLLVHSLKLVLGTGHLPLLHSLLQVISGMVAAEALQLERRGRFEPRRDLYLQVIRGKTAALFEWGLQAGGTVAQLPPDTLVALGKVGQSLGTAFQLVDDVLDLEGDPQLTGKDALVDVREGKLTWPIILAAERDKNLAHELQAIAQEPGRELSAARAQAVVQTIRRCGALEASKQFAREMAAAAQTELLALPKGQATTALQWVIESAVHRVA